MARHQRMPTLEAGYTYAVVPYLPKQIACDEEESIYGHQQPILSLLKIKVIRVFFKMEGTAGINFDYSVTNVGGGFGGYYVDIQPNELSRSVVLTPVFEQIEEENETVVIALLDFLDANHQYAVGSPSNAEIIILDFRDLVFSDSFEQ